MADIFRAHGREYRQQHALTRQQRAAMWAIEACRTEVLGGHLDVCADCGHARPSYNSCRNRHCPKCQALSQARWLAKRRQHLLPVGYFHVVFTLPSELRRLAKLNPAYVYALLFRAAAQALLMMGKDWKRLGALLGITAVLHTWTRDLRLHPHVHCIVTGGGLSLDEQRWVASRPRHLFPVKPLGRLFRGKLLEGLTQAYGRGHLRLPDNLTTPIAFAQLRAKLFKKDWVVYAKRPFAGADQVFSYLGRYTHRVGLSNHRILALSKDRVTLATRNGGTATMTPQEFIRRFLQHILPKGFIKIRHFGLLAPSHVRTKLHQARQALEAAAMPVTPPDAIPLSAGWRELLRHLTGIDLDVCPACGGRRIYRLLLEPAARQPAQASERGPP